MPLTYTRYAALCLAITVLAGTWMRVALLDPAWLGPLDLRHATHAHSHVALFGWTTMALMALVARAAGVTGREGAPGWTRWHPHAVGIASLAAFAGFLMVGYAPPTIALATLHVALWVIFAAVVWRPLGGAPPAERRFWRGALVLLLVAGAGAMVPGPVRVLGATDPWILGLSVELFLTPFMEGWLGLGVAGVLYSRLERPRFRGAVFRLLALGALPAALFRTAAPAPAAWLPLVGRAATMAVGAAALLLALDVLRATRTGRVPPLFLLAGMAALLEGVAEIAVAAGVGIPLLGNRQLTVAYLHLVLLGVVTPVLLGAAVTRARVPALAVVQGAGLAVTLAALAALGLSPLAGAAAAAGVSASALLGAALAGGVVSGVGVLGVVGVGWREERRDDPAAPARPMAFDGKVAARRRRA
ncbi:MAG TPA: hypothetical protein VGE02_13920 [Gemmatimonadales bacterium]